MNKFTSMNLEFTVFALVMLALCKPAVAQDSSAPRGKPALTSYMMCVDPSSTKVSLGKVSLVVGPLSHKGNFYVGEYQIKVVPYFFKNEKGTLQLEATDDLLRKLMGGIPVKFIGKATDDKKGKPKIIIGNATPSANNHGSVTFSIVTDNGLMVFNTSYHIGE